MKRFLGLSLILLILLAPAAPARADTDFSFSVSSGSYHGGPRHGWRESRWDRDWRRPPVWRARPAYAPFVVIAPAPRPVIYRETYVGPATTTIMATPVSDVYIDGLGRTCRTYESSQWLDGRSYVHQGTACFMPDGSWRAVN